MSDLKTLFETATREAAVLPHTPDNKSLLTLYALYKQATEGDVTGERPGTLDFVGRAKYDAWSALEGMPRSQAMREYAGLVGTLGASAGHPRE
ncbi:MAG: acyl-CoA-binding protein [Gammaproteobacteria bacterium]